MKLAEALAERKGLADRMTSLSQRARRSVVAPEGRAPLEAVTDILEELDQTLARWEERVVQINRANMTVRLENGMTLMEALARRDRLTRHIAILSEVMQVATGGPHERFGMVPREAATMVPTMDVSALQSRLDQVSAERMALDLAIQQAGWAYDM
ncbi:DIP1984 family protein [Sulfobacillus harzensis]|uniref:DIP1984 family protein n=1 Tax=Sulfobacillus harzensis TaxID=2729629 RepID=A0A7Y0L4B8_9FIRM|nr:DIP1984 family protein [Sulfobacillus harzensis]NMP22702.1 DIP1984 family protein [Sulfobacillus harzensis]